MVADKDCSLRDDMLILCWFTLYLHRITSLVFGVEWPGLGVATLISTETHDLAIMVGNVSCVVCVMSPSQ